MKGRAVYVVAGLAVLAIGVLLGVNGWQQSLLASRTIGITVSETERGLVIDSVASESPAAVAGLEAGDLIVEFDGRPIAGIPDLVTELNQLERHARVPVMVGRDDGPHTWQLDPGVAFPWGDFGLDVMVSLAYLAIALLALLRTPGGTAARLLFVFSLAVAVELAIPERVALIENWIVINRAVVFALAGVQIAVELHLASVIPRVFPWFERGRLVPAIYYVAGGAVALLGAAAPLQELAGSTLLPWSSATAVNLFYGWGFLLWGGAVISILIVQTRNTRTEILRSQALLVLMAVVIWVVFEFGVFVLGWFGLDVPVLFEVVQPFVLLCYPVAIFVAMYRYKLFDIEFVARRSVVFILLTTALVSIFYGIVISGSLVFASRVEGDGPPTTVVAGAMLILGLLFSPLHRWSRTAVARRLFPERFETRQRLTELAALLPTRGGLEAIGKELVHQLREILKLDSVTVLVADSGSNVLLTLASNAVDLEVSTNQSVLIEVDDPGVRFLSSHVRLTPVDELPASASALAYRAAIFQARQLIALCSGDTIIGLLLLGDKQDREPFRSEEKELISLFSHTVATVLENARLFASATYDGLTGILRREAILSLLEVELQRSTRYRRPLTVAMADIDHFKQVNDQYGHLAGDAILKGIAATLRSNLRATDFLGRYGGEEFLIFLPETQLAGAWLLAEKLRAAIAAAHFPLPNGGSLQTTISLGLAQFEPGGQSEENAAHVIARADAMLLAAKREGRNRVMPPQDADSGAESSLIDSRAGVGKNPQN